MTSNLNYAQPHAIYWAKLGSLCICHVMAVPIPFSNISILCNHFRNFCSISVISRWGNIINLCYPQRGWTGQTSTSERSELNVTKWLQYTIRSSNHYHECVETIFLSNFFYISLELLILTRFFKFFFSFNFIDFNPALVCCVIETWLVWQSFTYPNTKMHIVLLLWKIYSYFIISLPSLMNRLIAMLLFI